MSELEQLRKEVNELRERIVKLENKPAPVPLDRVFGGGQAPYVGGPIKELRQHNQQPIWLGENGQIVSGP